MTTRSFHIVDISHVKGSPADAVAVMKEYKGGKYTSLTPVGAAKKVLTKLASMTGVGECCCKIRIKEKGGRGKTYTYKVTRKSKTPIEVEKDGVTISFKFSTSAISI